MSDLVKTRITKLTVKIDLLVLLLTMVIIVTIVSVIVTILDANQKINVTVIVVPPQNVCFALTFGGKIYLKKRCFGYAFHTSLIF